VAVRHAADHIHIAAVLVRQDTGRRFWPHHDYPKLRAAARRIEERLGLTVTAAPDGTAASRPSRGEVEKAGREGRVPARVELRRAAQQAAIAATDVDGVVSYLQERGYRVELRRAPSGNLLGYKLARPGDTTAAGEPVFYSGSKLAPDLSLPRLLQRWASTPSACGTGRMPRASDVLEAVAAARARSVPAVRTATGLPPPPRTCSSPSPVADLVGGGTVGNGGGPVRPGRPSSRRAPIGAGSGGGTAAPAGPKFADHAGSGRA
jgi:hypothetical protein